MAIKKIDKYKWVGDIYPDWFREPASPLERTWRWPLLLSATQQFAKRKFGLKVPDDYYTVREGKMYIRTDWWRLLRQWRVLFLPFRFFKELFFEEKYFENNILPEYRKHIMLWNKEVIDLKFKDNIAVWNWAKNIMDVDVKYAVSIVYAGVYGFLLDFLLDKFYSKFVKDDPEGYHDLLSGFTNKTYEMNVALFTLSQIDKDSEEFKKKLREFIIEFGLEKSDWELALPVLGEHLQVIMHVVETYRQYPELNPKSKFIKAKTKRDEKFSYALNHMKLPFIIRPIFKWIVRWAQSYVPLRETRQYYIAAGSYFIRQALILLEGRLGLKDDMIFSLEKKELEKVIGNYTR